MLDHFVDKIYLTDIVDVLQLDGRGIECACSLARKTITPLELTMIKAVTKEVVVLLSSDMYHNTEKVYNIIRLLEAGITVTIIPKKRF